MAASPESIRNTVESYIKAVATGTADDVLALYAEGATVEDPVGTPVRTTRESIHEFYAIIEPFDQEAELVTLRIAANTAASGSTEDTFAPKTTFFIFTQPVSALI